MADNSLPKSSSEVLRPGGMGKSSSRILIYVILTLGLSFTLLPFIMMILSSFKTNVEVLRVPPTFWPENFTLEITLRSSTTPNSLCYAFMATVLL